MSKQVERASEVIPLWNIRNVPAVTRRRLKALAAIKDTSIADTLEYLIDLYWKDQHTHE